MKRYDCPTLLLSLSSNTSFVGSGTFEQLRKSLETKENSAKVPQPFRFTPLSSRFALRSKTSTSPASFPTSVTALSSSKDCGGSILRVRRAQHHLAVSLSSSTQVVPVVFLHKTLFQAVIQETFSTVTGNGSSRNILPLIKCLNLTPVICQHHERGRTRDEKRKSSRFMRSVCRQKRSRSGGQSVTVYRGR